MYSCLNCKVIFSSYGSLLSPKQKKLNKECHSELNLNFNYTSHKIQWPCNEKKEQIYLGKGEISRSTAANIFEYVFDCRIFTPSDEEQKPAPALFVSLLLFFIRNASSVE